MSDDNNIYTAGRFLRTQEGQRARKIAALKNAYQEGELYVDDAALARRLLETAVEVQRQRMLLDHLPTS